MRRGYSILILAIGFAAGSLQAQTVIEGTVQLPKPSFDRGLNQRYAASNDVPMAPTNPPAAVVYLEGDFRSQQANVSKTPARMTQKNIAFAPDLLPVLVGSAVEFPNMDDTYHNVFSYSKTKRFDLGRYRKDEKPTTVVFDKPGAVRGSHHSLRDSRENARDYPCPGDALFSEDRHSGPISSGASPGWEVRAESLGSGRRHSRASCGIESRHDFACQFSSQVTKPITFNYNFTAALSFRAKLLLAMMLVVLAVTTATV